MFIFPVQLTTSRIGNLTRLIHTLLYVMTIHTYISKLIADDTLLGLRVRIVETNYGVLRLLPSIGLEELQRLEK